MGSGGRAVALRPKKALLEAQAGWIGVRDLRDRTAAKPILAAAMENMYPKDAAVGAGIFARPGFLRTHTGALAAVEIQAIGQLSKTDGTEVTWALAGGQLYAYNWATNSWGSPVVTTANFTTATVTVATNVRVFSTQFVDNVIFSDGTNRPFMWDGTSGAAGLTDLTNAPVAYGKPVVYYAKLFFIKATERSTIVWSEENDPNVGYEAGGYNNAWTLGQTDQDELFALIPTNEALYYQRQFSTSAIWGQVTPNFQTTGVREAVSQTVGTASPGGWVVVGSRVYFLDALGRPQVIEEGSGLADPGPWHHARLLSEGVTKSKLIIGQAIYSPDLDLVLFGVPTANDEHLDQVLTLSPDSGVVSGIFTDYETGTGVQVLATVKDQNEFERTMYGTLDGYVFVQALSTGSDWDDHDTAGASVAVPHVHETAPFFYAVRESKILDRVDLSLVSAGLSGLSLRVRTERTLYDYGLVWDDTAVSGALWDLAIWDADIWDGDAQREIRASFGLDQYGRWFQVRIEHEALGESLGVLAVMAEAYSEGPDVRWP
jgi:hypothetical protein